MNISCVLKIEQIRNGFSDLVLLPEGVPEKDLLSASTKYPDSMIAGAYEFEGRSYGCLLHGGTKRIIYAKIGTDGRTQGSGDTSPNPVYENGNICVGMLVCMDVQNPPFSSKIIENVKSTDCDIKIICIPADMGPEWFSSINPQFQGVNLVLCNNVKTYPQIRCQSFITDTNRNKVIVQIGIEPIYGKLP